MLDDRREKNKLDSNPDPKFGCGSGSEHVNNLGSERVRIHNPAANHGHKEKTDPDPRP